jgi:hypothetical protein
VLAGIYLKTCSREPDDDDDDDDDDNKRYSFCLMVEASDHGYVLHTRRIHVTRYGIRYDMI